MIDTHPYTPTTVCMTPLFMCTNLVSEPQHLVWEWGRPAGSWKAEAGVNPRGSCRPGHCRGLECEASLKWIQLLMKFVSPHRGVTGTLCPPVWRNARESHWVEACLDSRGSVCSELVQLLTAEQLRSTAQHQGVKDAENETFQTLVLPKQKRFLS